MHRPAFSLALLALLVFPAAVRSEHATRTDPAEALGRAVDAAFAKTAGTRFPGAAIVVLRDGRVVLSRAAGLADLETGEAVTTRTRFRLASVSKTFTALLVLRLVEQGKLSLDDPVARYVPQVPGGESMTIRHVLSHTAGLTDFVSLDEALTLPLDGAPGERLNYSNVGYQLLARVVGKAGGRPFEEALHAEILDPLGMKDTGVDLEPPAGKGWAKGYVVTAGGQPTPAEFTPTRGERAASGGLHSTAEDMTVFLQALLDGRIVAPSTLALATTPVTLAGGRPGAYGFGFMTTPFRGLAEFGHGGDISGFNTWFSVYPQERLAVVVLSNVGMRPPGPLPTAGDIAHGVVEAAAGGRLGPEWPPALDVPLSVLARYAGRYRLVAPPAIVEAMGATLDVGLDGNRFLASSKMGQAELFPETETLFFSKGPGRIAFTVAEDGRCDGAVLSLMGLREYRLERER